MYQVVVFDIETLAEADAIADAIVVLLYDRDPENTVRVVFGDDAEGAEQSDADGGERGPRKIIGGCTICGTPLATV